MKLKQAAFEKECLSKFIYMKYVILFLYGFV